MYTLSMVFFISISYTSYPLTTIYSLIGNPYILCYIVTYSYTIVFADIIVFYKKYHYSEYLIFSDDDLLFG